MNIKLTLVELAVADLMAYELTHYYHLRKNRPELSPRGIQANLRPSVRAVRCGIQVSVALVDAVEGEASALGSCPGSDVEGPAPVELIEQYPEPTHPKRRIANAARVGWEEIKIHRRRGRAIVTRSLRLAVAREAETTGLPP